MTLRQDANRDDATGHPHTRADIKRAHTIATKKSPRDELFVFADLPSIAAARKTIRCRVRRSAKRRTGPRQSHSHRLGAFSKTDAAFSSKTEGGTCQGRKFRVRRQRRTWIGRARERYSVLFVDQSRALSAGTDAPGLVGRSLATGRPWISIEASHAVLKTTL